MKKETGLEEDLSVEEDLARFINVSHFDLTILCSGNKHFLSSNSVSFSLLDALSTDVLITSKAKTFIVGVVITDIELEDLIS